MYKILWISDGVIPTGFGRVTHSIIDKLPKDLYEIHHLAVNYRGDPHDFDHKIYPAGLRGHIYGYNRIQEFVNLEPDLIFIFNDSWVINDYLNRIKSVFKDSIPPIIVYFPVDGSNHDSEWFTNFDIVTQPVVYTKFGYDVAKKAYPDGDFKIIQHGVNTKIFYPLDEPKHVTKKRLYPDNPEIYDKNSFIVLNANRNQPRKRIDVAVEGFCLFAKDKPETVKYYHHAGIRDVGWDVLKLFSYFDQSHRLIITSLEMNVQTVPDDKLNHIYNATDVGLNCSFGEGFGLVSAEHSATGAPQIVPANSASKELYEDCGITIPISQEIFIEKTNTKGGLVRPEDVAERLNWLYRDEQLYKSVAYKCYNKFTSEEYSWEHVASIWNNLFLEVLEKNKTKKENK